MSDLFNDALRWGERNRKRAENPERDARVAEAERQLAQALGYGDFVEFHRQNPGVFDWFEREALRAVGNFGRVSMRYLYERARVDRPVKIVGTDEFILNNSLVACYARALVIENPSLSDHIELRRIAMEGDGNDAG